MCENGGRNVNKSWWAKAEKKRERTRNMKLL
jgi:hypothetical protein